VARRVTDLRCSQGRHNHMDDKDDHKFHSYIRGHGGALELADCIRRCGRLVPRHEPESRREGPSSRRLADLLEFCREITYGLNTLQRRTFLRLLLGTLEDTANSFGISRAAVYSRIRGRDGNGGMIAQNEYVRIWWTGRKKTNQYE